MVVVELLNSRHTVCGRVFDAVCQEPQGFFFHLRERGHLQVVARQNGAGFLDLPGPKGGIRGAQQVYVPKLTYVLVTDGMGCAFGDSALVGQMVRRHRRFCLCVHATARINAAKASE
jgi:hypothetical protein